MHEIGTAAGIAVSAPSDSPISFFNSPYIGHRLATAVDIYTSDREWGSDIVSPVAGVVTRVRRMKMGQMRTFPSEEHDYAIGIQTDESTDLVVRILHCRPSVDVKEHVEVGDPIGSSIRSRFFCYWTSPHCHVEVMALSNFHRASQSRLLEVSKEACKIDEPLDASACEGISLTVAVLEPDFLIGTLDSSMLVSLGESVGHAAVDASGNLLGILDTGFPHYSVCGVRRADSEVYLRNPRFQSIPLGESVSCQGGLSAHKQLTGFKVFLDETLVRGVSTYIYRRANLIHGKLPLKVIPLTRGGFLGRVSEGDVVRLSWTKQV